MGNSRFWNRMTSGAVTEGAVTTTKGFEDVCPAPGQTGPFCRSRRRASRAERDIQQELDRKRKERRPPKRRVSPRAPCGRSWRYPQPPFHATISAALGILTDLAPMYEAPPLSGLGEARRQGCLITGGRFRDRSARGCSVRARVTADIRSPSHDR